MITRLDPNLEELDFEGRMRSLVERVRSYHAEADVEKLWRAFREAMEAHKDQKRKSGEPYFTHVLSVAEILAGLRMDVDTIASGLLHDVVEDTSIGLGDLRESFGEDVSLLVDGVTKINEIRYENPEAQQAENYRKMLLTMARDVRVILIKLADRLHNMRTISSLRRERQVAIAQETLTVYAPLAHRFGIARIKWELEDLAFKTLHPEEYATVLEGISQRRAERESIIEQFHAQLRGFLEEAGIEAEIQGRAKHFYSIWQKMVKRNVPIDQVFDLLAIRVVVEQVDACYHTLGIVHAHWRPLHDRLKDYIATPKRNMYQSLHTTVRTDEGHLMEVQIRTRDMHSRADFGIAAHWLYKEGGAAGDADRIDEQMQWFREVLDLQQDLIDPREFMEALRIDLFQDEVFVFSPAGDVFKMPHGSTPLDFAFHVHSQVGLRCTGARVNGKLVSLRHELQSGETVEILTQKNSSPSPGWLEIVRTSKAKHHIRHWLKATQLDESIKLGREMLERELKKKHAKLKLDVDLVEVAQDLGHLDPDRLLAAIGSGSVALTKVVNKLLPEQQAKPKIHIALPARLRQALDRRNEDVVRIQGLGNLMIRFARCCQPVPGDPIRGIVTVGRGVSIHRQDCENLLPARIDPERLLDVTWDVGEDTTFPVQLVVAGHDRLNLLADISRVISDLGSNIQAGSFSGEHEYAQCTFLVEVRNLSHLGQILKAIRKLPGVTRVERAAISLEPAASENGESETDA